MKQVLFITFIFFTFFAQAQNVTEKTFSAQNITSINIDGDSMFNITLEAIKTNKINIKSRIEGEHNEQIILVTEIKNNTLFISIKKQPLFVDDNDKLSAHKVISIDVHLVIPENKNILLSSNIANVIVKGQYENASVDLQYGNCFLFVFQGNANVNTIDGNITINTNFATVQTESKNGFIEKEKIDSGSSQIFAKTINGNITVNALTKSQ